MNIYDENGYLRIEQIINKRMPFTFIIGGRGTGKTYGALKYTLDSGRKFMLMRRTQTQAELVTQNPTFSPFKTINRDCSRNIEVEKLSDYTSGYYDADVESDTHQYIGYTCALSTIKNLRGFDASDIDLIIYDEFIPEKHEKAIKNESDALMNAYQTINRNRELNGEAPCQLLCLANSNDIANPIFMGLGMVSIVEKMLLKKKEVYMDKNKGLMIIVLNSSPISSKKKQTALYKLTQGSDFFDMATNNDFLVDTSSVSRLPLNECSPFVAVGELCIYKHKSNGKYYCTTHKSGSPETFKNNETDLMRFKRIYKMLWIDYVCDSIIFETVFCEKLFNAYMK